MLLFVNIYLAGVTADQLRWIVVMIYDDGEEDRAKTRGLGGSYAGNKQQILARFWTHPGHLDQDAVMEYDEGRLFWFSRDFEAFGLEGGEQAVCRAVSSVSWTPGLTGSKATRASARSFAWATSISPKLRRTEAVRPLNKVMSPRSVKGASPKHCTTRPGDNPTIPILRVLRDQIRRVKLVKNAAPFGRIELFADAECRQEIVAMPPGLRRLLGRRGDWRGGPEKIARRCGGSRT